MKKYAPFILAAAAVLLDQITKALVVAHIPVNDMSSFITVIGPDFLIFNHVRNTGVALSFGANSPEGIRWIFFKILPLLVMGYLGLLITRREKEGFTALQGWFLGGIMGGGLGNLIDRFFRPEGVVDWVSVKFYGIFGWSRFPTFNVADAFISVCAVGLFITFILSYIKKASNKEGEGNE